MDIDKFLLKEHLMTGEVEPDNCSSGTDIDMLDLSESQKLITHNFNNDMTPISLPLKRRRIVNGKLKQKGKASKPFNFLRIIGKLKSQADSESMRIAHPNRPRNLNQLQSGSKPNNTALRMRSNTKSLWIRSRNLVGK